MSGCHSIVHVWAEKSKWTVEPVCIHPKRYPKVVASSCAFVEWAAAAFTLCVLHVFLHCLVHLIVPVMKTYGHVSNGVLARAWTPNVQKLYNIWPRQFYELRKARHVVPEVSAGRPQKTEISCRGQQLNVKRKPTAKTDATSIKRNKLKLVYPWLCFDRLHTFLTQIMLTVAFGREFARIGIDPLKHTIQWSSSGFTPAMFRRVLKCANPAFKHGPSIHSAIFGKSGETSMHMHNFFIVDDADVKNIFKLVQKWQDMGIEKNVQTQLISLLSVFNGKAVARHNHIC